MKKTILIVLLSIVTAFFGFAAIGSQVTAPVTVEVAQTTPEAPDEEGTEQEQPEVGKEDEDVGKTEDTEKSDEATEDEVGKETPDGTGSEEQDEGTPVATALDEEVPGNGQEAAPEEEQKEGEAQPEDNTDVVEKVPAEENTVETKQIPFRRYMAQMFGLGKASKTTKVALIYSAIAGFAVSAFLLGFVIGHKFKKKNKDRAPGGVKRVRTHNRKVTARPVEGNDQSDVQHREGRGPRIRF